MRMLWDWMRRYAVPALLFTGTACYEYRDASLADVRPDVSVHVVLSAAGSTALAPTIGPNATSIDGRVLSVGAGTMRLAATQIARAVGPEEFLQNEPIDLPTAGTLSISTRSVDRVRTVLTVAAIIAGVFAAHALSDQPAIVSTKGGPSGGTK
jgi:hypothetical protein